MVKVLSYIIAVVLTLLLALALYPIAILFWVLKWAGQIVGIISDWIFVHTNSAITRLWQDLKGSSD